MLGLEVVRKVADGSAVEAFLADSAAGRVLVQVSRPAVTADPETYGRFLDWTREATTQHQHPALLAPQVAHCTADGRFVLLTGPVSGRTAVEHLKEQGPLSLPEAVRWGLRLCEALDFLHQHGVAHGHLSPQNVFLDGDPRRPDVRLLDTALLLFRARKSLQTGQVLVPPEYLSPERAAGRRATPATDVYGLGVLLHELVMGAPPFSGRSASQTRAMHLHAPPPPLRPGFEPLHEVVARCLAKQPGDRFDSIRELHQALVRLAQHLQAQAAAAARAARTPTPALPAVARPAPSVAAERTPALPVEVDIAIDVEEAPRGPDELRPGDVLGRYRIEGSLGEGGMGRVYAARHLSIDRRVAVKVLRRELARDEAAVQRFVGEAQAVSRVRHPHIIAVEDLVREGERVYIVMELLEGRSLKQVARDAPLELVRAVRLVRQAAEALAAAHAVGVVHRDVKPDNLHVVPGPQETLKVLDFGVARVRDSGPRVGRLTQAGQVVGTPLWMAPEQVVGHDVDGRADVYALGMVLYVLLTRRFPFAGTALSQVVMQRLQGEAEALPARTFLGEAVPERLSAAVAMMLARDPGRRPTSMLWVVQELRAVEVGLTSPPPTSSAPPRRGFWQRFKK